MTIISVILSIGLIITDTVIKNNETEQNASIK